MNNYDNYSTWQPGASCLCCTEGSTISPSALTSDPHIGNGTTLWDTVCVLEEGGPYMSCTSVLKPLNKTNDVKFHPS